MVATPQYGQMIFQGQSGTTYAVDLYVSDVNNGLVNFDGGGGAGSSAPTQWICPENVTLKDFSMTTGTADTEKVRLVVNNKPTGSVLRYVQHVSTNSNRPVLNIGFAKGSQVSAFQISD